MRANRRHALALGSILVSLHTGLLMTAARASAAPSAPNDDPCDALIGPAKEICEKGDDGGSSGGGGGGGGGQAPSPDYAADPLKRVAKGCADAASWTVDKLADLVNSTTKVDFTNGEFLRQYAVVFAASTVLTLLLWLLAVAKRAVRGVPLTTALTEAIGFLWLTVLASAFTPLILYTVVSATDSVTDIVASGTSGKTDQFFGTFSEALKKGNDIGGGPIMLIVVSLVSVVAAGILYLELVIRAAMLYVGALLGTAVYAGLVDKNLWGHVRRWAGIMIAVILVKPVVVIVLGLAGALAGGDEGPGSASAIISGLAIILLAIFASAMIYRFVPGFGDDIAAHRSATRQATRGASAFVQSPATLVRQGINTHGGRGSGGGGGGAQSGASGGGGQSGGAVSGGVTAHSARGGGGAPSGAPSGGSGGAAGGAPVRKQPAPPNPPTPHAARPPRPSSPKSNRPSGGDRR